MAIDYSVHNSRYPAYTVALQNAASVAPLRPASEFRGGRLPAALSAPADLNFLDPVNPFFFTDRVLVSYGQNVDRDTPPGIFTACDRSRITILGDSAGLQFSRGTKPWRGDASRRGALDWLERHTQEAMSLDAATLGIGMPGSPFQSFEACLETTLENLRYFDRHRTGRTRLLNVIQGRDRIEGDRWEDRIAAVETEGVAFAGPLRLDPFELTRRVIRLWRRGMISERKNRLHILGTARLDRVVLLAALQSGLRRRVHPSITVTFDSSTPSILTAAYKGVTGVRMGPGDFRVLQGKLPRTHEHIGSTAPFPFRGSAIAKELTIGDLCVGLDNVKQSSWDQWSSVLLTNHNLHCLLEAFVTANAIMEMGLTAPSTAVEAEQHAPAWLVAAIKAVHRVFDAKDPIAELNRSKRLFAPLAGLEAEGEQEETRFPDAE